MSESETEDTVASKDNEIDISPSTPLSLSMSPLINRKKRARDKVLPEEAAKRIEYNSLHNAS